ncbi:MAG: AtpZ/AtpI family protein [Campylobacterales bacterium]|nr:AtpZ/AtpI family protein [Campylobacterales bacterium]
MKEEEKPRIRRVIEGAEQLTLGVSMVVALVLGTGAGILMRDMTGIGWLLWVGVAWGVAAAGLNVRKAYKRQLKSLDEYNKETQHEQDKEAK